MSRLWKHRNEAAWTSIQPLPQQAVGVAGDHQVIAVGDAPIRQLHGRETLRAATRSREGHNQRGHGCLEIARRTGHEIGGGDRLDPALQDATEVGQQALADVGRRTGAGQEDTQILFQQ